MQTFPMTRDRFHLLTPLIVSPLLLAALAGTRRAPPGWLGPAGTLLVGAGLGITGLMAPRAVRLTPEALVIERFCWPAFRVPLSSLERVSRGPDAKLAGGVLRIAGVGGWFWSGGLFWVKGVGKVRAWLTRLGPTVLLTRKAGLPILLGVDDADGLLDALRALKGG